MYVYIYIYIYMNIYIYIHMNMFLFDIGQLRQSLTLVHSMAPALPRPTSQSSRRRNPFPCQHLPGL